MTGVLLLALAGGYGVLVLSQSQQKPLNTLGRIIGGIILVASFLGLICSAACGMKGMCHKKAMCPWTGAATSAAPVTPPAN